jgi:hypothetical protein
VGRRGRQGNGTRWLVAALAVLTVVALVQSVQTERSEAYGLTHVLHRADGHELADLARDGSTQMRERYGFYLELRPDVEGGTVVLPTAPRTLAVTAVRGLAGAEVLRADFDPSIGPEVARALRDEARVEGAVETPTRVIGAVGPSGPAPVHVVLVDEDGTAYVTATAQLRRHGIAPDGLDLDALSVRAPRGR